MLPVFIGFDPRETVAYSVLSHSIIHRSSVPVCIIGLCLSQLPMTRARNPLQSTEFAFSRFLVPWLSDYKGFSIFMDCDMLCRGDITELWNLRDPEYAVQVVKHDYTPSTGTKFLGQKQTRYPRKNWSSVMIFNNSKCRVLTQEYVNEASGLELHRFQWTDSIGELPKEWNYLATEENQVKPPKLIHFTCGGPWFSEYENTEYAELWRDEFRDMLGGYELR